MTSGDSCVIFDICSSEVVGGYAAVMKDMNHDENATAAEMEPASRRALPKANTAAASATGPFSSSEAYADSEMSNSDVGSTGTDASESISTRNNNNDEVIDEQASRHPHNTERKAPATDIGAFSTSRNPSPLRSDSEQQIDEEITADRESKQSASPQHADDVDPVNTYRQDMDFEVALQSQRNKRVLLSRLGEVAPRGRLSIVRHIYYVC